MPCSVARGAAGQEVDRAGDVGRDEAFELRCVEEALRRLQWPFGTESHGFGGGRCRGLHGMGVDDRRRRAIEQRGPLQGLSGGP